MRLLAATLALLLGCTSSSSSSPHHMAAGARSPATVASAWFLDPAATLPCTSDSNTCQSATCGATGIGPCQHIGEIISRWQTPSPTLAQATTITALSSQSSPWNDPWNVRPSLAPGGSFHVVGVPSTVTTATIGTFTARNRSAGTPNRITAAGQSGAYWSAFVGDLVQDTTAGAWFWIEKDLGSATAQISEPFAAITSIVPSYVTIANLDALTILAPPAIDCHDLGVTDYITGVSSGSSIDRVKCAATGATHTFRNIAVYESAIASTLADFCETSYDLNDFISAPLVNGGFVVGGALTANTPALSCQRNHPGGIATYDGDVLLDIGGPMHVYGFVEFGRAYLSSGTRFTTDVSETATLTIGQYTSPGIFFGDSELWGAGGIELHEGAQLICESTCGANVLLSGALTVHGASTAFPWSATSHAWAAAATISPGLIDDAGAMCDPQTGDCFRKHP